MKYKNLRTRRSCTELRVLERADLSLLTPAGKHIRTFQDGLYWDNWPTRMITLPAIIETARPLISPGKTEHPRNYDASRTHRILQMISPVGTAPIR